MKLKWIPVICLLCAALLTGCGNKGSDTSSGYNQVINQGSSGTNSIVIHETSSGIVSGEITINPPDTK